MMGATMHSSAAAAARGTPASTANNNSAARHQPLDSGQLLRGQRVVEITHNGELYRLQATRFGKLILTK